MPSIRLVFVTDVHHGRDHLTKKGSAALPLLAEVGRAVADARADAVIDLGDRISDTDGPSDFRREQEVAEAFRAIPAPCHHVCGNHDLVHLSVADNERALGQSLAPQAIDLGAWRLVLWRADARLHGPDGFRLAEQDVRWLAGIARDADRPLVVTSHIPVSGHAQTGNYYFHNNPQYSTYAGAEQVRAVLRQAAVPVVWVAGHVHWNTVTLVDGIPHVTLQSLTETFTTHPEPAAAWGLLELGESIAWRAHGRDPVSFSMPAADAARRWMMPLPPFDPRRARRAPTVETGRLT